VPIIATAGGGGKTFTPAPEGVHQAVCVDVIDIGQKPNPFKPGTTQHKIDLAWQINQNRDDGKRFVVYKRYTLSLNEKATLRHDLESWRGRPFTAKEEEGFDVLTIIGANCLMNVQHKPSNDGTRIYANVISVMPLIAGMAKITDNGYERKAVEQTDGTNTYDRDITPVEQVTPVTDDDIPF
jgi:hypothetical protein